MQDKFEQDSREHRQILLEIFANVIYYLFLNGTMIILKGVNERMTKIDRNVDIINKVVQGKTLESVGEEYGLTKMRICDIIKRAGYEKRYVKKEEK